MVRISGSRKLAPPTRHLAPSGDKVLVNTVFRPTQRRPQQRSDWLLSIKSDWGQASVDLTRPRVAVLYSAEKDSLGRFRYNIHNNRAFIGTKGAGKGRGAGRFVIADASSGKILVEDKNSHKITQIGTHMWYVIGERIYSTWDRHHSPNRGGRKPLAQSKWSDAGIEVMRDEQWSLCP